MYAKTVIRRVIELQAHGFTGEETKKALNTELQVDPCLDTIYRMRRSTVGKEMLEELIRQQERDILKSETDNRELAMAYRQKLIDFMGNRIMPPIIREEIRSQHSETMKVFHLHMWRPGDDASDTTTDTNPIRIPTVRKTETVPR